MLQLIDEKGGWMAAISRTGALDHLETRLVDEWRKIKFRHDRLAGPAWNGVKLDLADRDELLFQGKHESILYSLQYKSVGGKLAMIAGIKNNGTSEFQPEAARLTLGLDTEMIKYPEWNEVFFPTLLRCEKSHFWGYAMTPKGRILAFSSPDPVASWQYEFQPLQHRIYTVSLDLLHCLPLPARHPQDMTGLKSGEEKSWTIFLQEIDSLENVKPVLAETVQAPMIEIDRYTVAEGETAKVTVFSPEKVTALLQAPTGGESRISVSQENNDEYVFNYKPDQGAGVYTVKVTSSNGKISEAKIYQRLPWSWYQKQARKEAIRIPQKASGHVESWLGHFSNYLARRYFPDQELDRQAEHNFRTILPFMYDLKEARPVASMANRIVNHFYMVSLLVDVYRASGNIEDLELASRLGDWLLATQGPDGAYYRSYGVKRAHVTCVGYPAKSMLELAAAEKELAASDPTWRERYERHFSSAKAAVDDLQRRLDDIETEGQATYEDGMISCSGTQLAMFALLEKDRNEREKYLKAAKYMFSGHRCLDQMIVPDCRINEGSIRFWESQYDVMIPNNMMNSPHGWTAWRIPGFFYMYQLTGEEYWLRRAMNSLGSCVQLIDIENGRLRCSFAQDPYVYASVLEQDPQNQANNKGVRVNRVIGEQYIEMISHFYRPRLDAEVGEGGILGGGACDNNVHEIFKALEEVVLTAACVVERSDGEVVGYNCDVKKADGELIVVPSEGVVTRVHLNLRNKRKVTVSFGNGARVSGEFEGLHWIGPGGVPEDLR